MYRNPQDAVIHVEAHDRCRLPSNPLKYEGTLIVVLPPPQNSARNVHVSDNCYDCSNSSNFCNCGLRKLLSDVTVSAEVECHM